MWEWFSSLPKELAVLIVAALPVFELRGAIPLGLKLGLGISKTCLLSVLGNLAPILPLLLFFRAFFHELRRFRLFNWWFTKAERKSGLVEKWGFWGLTLFVGTPLPGTGVWTGAVVATLVEMKTGRAFWAIFLGVFMACALVALGSMGVLKLWFSSI